MAVPINDPILLHVKGNKRSTLIIDKSLYERNKEDYDKVGYVVADQETVKEYFGKKGIPLIEAVEEKEEPKKKSKKKQDTEEITPSESVKA